MFRARSLAIIFGLIFAALVAFAPMASAQTDSNSYPIGTTPPTVLGNTFEKSNPPPPASVGGTTSGGNSNPVAQVNSGGATLPVTGSDVFGLTILGLVAVGAGVVLVRYQRGAAARV